MVAAATRQQIVEAADRLFYERGFEATSFADIAGEVGLSRGNFYYHFKTKDELLDAVITHRLLKTRSMLDMWEAKSKTPEERIVSFVSLLVVNQAKIMAYGCPVGTLCNELAKLDHLAKDRAAEIFSMFRHWLSHQFIAFGREAEADALAMHILMRSQGVATLAAAYRDEIFVRNEVENMRAWLAAQRPGTPVPPETLSRQHS
ncbi:TetR/AcrR family transcriptional regulator [Rhizobium lentis]|uniref:TetR/AcrR family transcriptional regulator n=1 Tax=Rhizobium lentis TaxID=1138194 RepID=A0A9Q3M7Z4_9HYPH|nr:TetR/AcrR family transcriptional regulator [Rhizobium lentis]MBX5023505.1 TetR/AcrR family transcriptional regulator [Rhizobium lentis]MBX5046926.1 TetR/AcrR family transcriptional regulator [Rhizobium lentis]MBX5058938.1 TetR/AcrR family transcriptional regulator [Rhizobium lentis]MBX5066426.1 TetR/AcrR family transcriptional regulator [Rhizobium lentis]MBX5077494.1 TetR/AcrR family transcriptional regulator [Rhizobium lentis]